MQIEQRLFQARDRLRRRLAAALTPQQRIERLAVILDDCARLLAANPEAMDRFWRRNLRKRAVRRESNGST
jgi:hypothetical protein